MQTIKEMFCYILNAVLDSLEYLVCTIRHEYWSIVVNFLYFDHMCCPHLSTPCYSWFHGSVISLKTWQTYSCMIIINTWLWSILGCQSMYNHQLIYEQVFWNNNFIEDNKKVDNWLKIDTYKKNILWVMPKGLDNMEVKPSQARSWSMTQTFSWYYGIPTQGFVGQNACSMHWGSLVENSFSSFSLWSQPWVNCQTSYYQQTHCT